MFFKIFSYSDFITKALFDYPNENLSYFLGENAFCGDTVTPKGLRGSQFIFKFTIR